MSSFPHAESAFSAASLWGTSPPGPAANVAGLFAAGLFPFGKGRLFEASRFRVPALPSVRRAVRVRSHQFLGISSGSTRAMTLAQSPPMHQLQISRISEMHPTNVTWCHLALLLGDFCTCPRAFMSKLHQFLIF